MYITVIDGKMKMMNGREPYSPGISKALQRTTIKKCGWLWKKYALYITDPDSIRVAAPYGSVGSLVRVSPRFRTAMEVKLWVESQSFEEFFGID